MKKKMTLMKEIKYDTNRWRGISCSWRMFLKNQYCEYQYYEILPKTIHRFSSIPIKLPMTIFTELKQNKQKSQFVWKHKRPQIDIPILRRKAEQEKSTFLTSHYTTKLQSSVQYSTGTKTEI